MSEIANRFGVNQISHGLMDRFAPTLGPDNNLKTLFAGIPGGLDMR